MHGFVTVFNETATPEVRPDMWYYFAVAMRSKTKQAEKWRTAYAMSPHSNGTRPQQISCGKNCTQIDFTFVGFSFFFLLHSFNYQSVRNMLSDFCVRAFASTLFLAERLQNRPVLQSIFDDLFRVCVIWCDYIFYFRAISFSSVVSCLLVLNGCICAIVEHRSMSK